jgi:hypothetical protein
MTFKMAEKWLCGAKNKFRLLRGVAVKVLDGNCIDASSAYQLLES